MYTSETRRRVLKAVLVLPVLATANLGRNALAEELPALEESDPTAQALGYTTDASTGQHEEVSDVPGGQPLRDLHALQG